MAIVSAIFSVMLIFLIIGTIIVIIFDSGDSATKIAWFSDRGLMLRCINFCSATRKITV